MNTTQKTAPPRLRYHPRAYDFLFAALRRSQQQLGRTRESDAGDEHFHITGPELLEGIRGLALEQFGLMARTVFRCWSIHTTEDFGRMVFDRIERGEMSKTDSDQLSDFSDVFDFEEALDQQYQIDVSHAFS
jgi:uncharacterized repeat protein (TIGR04138 family)